MNKVLLINADSKIPNLALMKISAYHKLIGDNVSFQNTDNPDIVYASVIFKKNKHLVDGYVFYYPDSEIIVGGSGYDINVKLPDYIECLKPDYSIYPNKDYSIGYSSRGCNRSCYFCIVPQKEGRFYRTQHPAEWHDDNFDKIVFLDNNVLLDKEWFIEITNWCIDKKLKSLFTQGFDIRLVDEDIANQLSKIKMFKGYHFAFDDIKLESMIVEKCELLKQHGINLKQHVQFFVYIDDNNGYADGVYRCRLLKSIGTNAFVMFNIDNKRSTEIKHLQRWANRRHAFWSFDILEYNRSQKPTVK